MKSMTSKLFQNFPNHCHLFTRKLIRKLVAVLATGAKGTLVQFFQLAVSKTNFIFEMSVIFFSVKGKLYYRFWLKKIKNHLWIKMDKLTKKNDEYSQPILIKLFFLKFGVV